MKILIEAVGNLKMKSDERTLWEGKKAIVPLKKIVIGTTKKKIRYHSIGADVPMEKQKIFRERS